MPCPIKFGDSEKRLNLEEKYVREKELREHEHAHEGVLIVIPISDEVLINAGSKTELGSHVILSNLKHRHSCSYYSKKGHSGSFAAEGKKSTKAESGSVRLSGELKTGTILKTHDKNVDTEHTEGGELAHANNDKAFIAHDSTGIEVDIRHHSALVGSVRAGTNNTTSIHEQPTTRIDPLN